MTKIAKLEVGYLKGDINGVTVKVRTDNYDDLHIIHYARSTVTRGDSPIGRNRHKHPWGNKVKPDPQEMADDAIEARNAAQSEMEKRGLLDEEEWHDD